MYKDIYIYYKYNKYNERGGSLLPLQRKKTSFHGKRMLAFSKGSKINFKKTTMHDLV